MPDALAGLFSEQQPDYEKYEALYKHFHAYPELSLQEARTSEEIAKHPALQPYTLHTHIGGHGLAAVLGNGSGPKILLRADMDALPVHEQTGLPYASEVRMKDNDGIEKPVMHACGHDMHITCLLAAAEHLASLKSSWKGTLIALFQPNEERAGGADAMVKDALYDKIPIPDVVLGQHVMPQRAGRVMLKPATMMAAADSFKITLFGRGGHGSMPHTTIDPVVLAANVVVRLQTIVSREIDPAQPAVLTVGSLQAGQTENVIADQAVLRLNVRSQTTDARERILASMRRIIEGECKASGCVKDPLIEETTRFPLTVNDEHIAGKLRKPMGEFFGSDFDPSPPVHNASEDVSILATSVNRPCCFWHFGGIDGRQWDQVENAGRIGEDIPSNHSALFAPAIQPTLKTGVEALCVAALTLLDDA